MPGLLDRLNRPVVAILAVVAIAGGIRAWDLSHPQDPVFDEQYYPKAACIFIGGSDETCMIESSDELYWREDKWDVGSWVHPPLGKWMIGMGEKAFGMTPVGWRSASALAGTLAVVLTAMIAQLLFASPLWTFLTGLLLSVESMNVVHSRIGLLDAHLELWVVLTFLFLVLDRRWIDSRTPADPGPGHEARAGPSPASTSGEAVTVVVAQRTARHAPARVPSPIWRPWRFAAGAAAGAAVSTKWSGVTAILGAVILSYLWEAARRRRDGVSWLQAFGRAFARETLGLVMAFLLLPAAVYLVSYLPWFNHFGWSPRAWWENQTAMWGYHSHLSAAAVDPSTGAVTPTHYGYSRPWTWLLMLKPVNYFSRTDGDVSQILAIGNPAIFWASVWTLPYLVFACRRKRDWRAGFVLVAALALYLPWFLVSRPQFIFYVLPMTPFLVLAAAYTLRDLSDATIVMRDPASGHMVESRQHPYRPFVWGYVVAAVALFVWFYPVLTAHPLSPTMWKARVWFQRWT